MQYVIFCPMCDHQLPFNQIGKKTCPDCPNGEGGKVSLNMVFGETIQEVVGKMMEVRLTFREVVVPVIDIDSDNVALYESAIPWMQRLLKSEDEKAPPPSKPKK